MSSRRKLRKLDLPCMTRRKLPRPRTLRDRGGADSLVVVRQLVGRGRTFPVFPTVDFDSLVYPGFAVQTNLLTKSTLARV